MSYQEIYSKTGCAKCNKTNIRLYIAHGSFYRPESVLCNEHVPAEQRNSYFPVVFDTDGSVWASADSDPVAGDFFFNLPEGDPNGPHRLRKPLLEEGRYVRWVGANRE